MNDATAAGKRRKIAAPATGSTAADSNCPLLRQVEAYANRFGGSTPRITSRPEASLKVVVVIPCHHEPELIESLRSLRQCHSPACAVEVIVVVNAPRGASPAVQHQNEISIREAQAWAASHPRPGFALHLLDCPDLLPRDAGVGLARKIGMDEALWRLAAAGQDDGLIVCFDADCTCDENYLQALTNYFVEHPRSPGCSVYFEHPLVGAHPPPVYEAIVLYELHLRFYVEALRFAGFPFAYHTIGSSMAVRARIYREQGGMNKRKAGEDFYFLHKIIPLGNFGEVNNTTVHPSPRPSERVPFGTGRAVRRYLAEGALPGYPLVAFQDLKDLFSLLPLLHAGAEITPPLPKAMQSYCLHAGLPEALEVIRGNTASSEAFRKRFFRWFNGFHAMKYIHHARDNFYGQKDVVTEAARLWRDLGETPCKSALPGSHDSARFLLSLYRERQRQWRPATSDNPVP